MKRKPGRPEGRSDIRDLLLVSARSCFLSRDYKSVTTREVALGAGTNLAMIHYYFGNKEGLYLAMLDELIRPMEEELGRRVNDTSIASLKQLIQTYFKTMIRFPEFPILMDQIIKSENAIGKAFLEERLAYRLFPDLAKMLRGMQKEGAIHAETDLEPLRITLISLLFYPFTMQPMLKTLLGVEPTEDFYLSLADFSANFVESALATA